MSNDNHLPESGPCNPGFVDLQALRSTRGRPGPGHARRARLPFAVALLGALGFVTAVSALVRTMQGSDESLAPIRPVHVARGHGALAPAIVESSSPPHESSAVTESSASPPTDRVDDPQALSALAAEPVLVRAARSGAPRDVEIAELVALALAGRPDVAASSRAPAPRSLPGHNAIRHALAAMAEPLRACGLQAGDRATVAVEFSRDGHVSSAEVLRSSVGTEASDCISNTVSRARVAPFDDEPLAIEFPYAVQ